MASKYLPLNGYALRMSSIMASDPSPTGEYKEFSYATPGGRSTPPPTTSYLSARQESQAIAIDQTVAKPTADRVDKEDDLKEKEQKEKDEADTGAPDSNAGHKPDERRDDRRDASDGGGGGGDKDSKLNGGGKLEAQFMLPLDAKDADDEVDNSCAVNCLYYTMQCCECIIT